MCLNLCDYSESCKQQVVEQKKKRRNILILRPRIYLVCFFLCCSVSFTHFFSCRIQPVLLSLLCSLNAHTQTRRLFLCRGSFKKSVHKKNFCVSVFALCVGFLVYGTLHSLSCVHGTSFFFSVPRYFRLKAIY